MLHWGNRGATRGHSVERIKTLSFEQISITFQIDWGWHCLPAASAKGPANEFQMFLTILQFHIPIHSI